MKQVVFALVIIILVFCSCKKNSDSPHVEQDILTTGWTKQVIADKPHLFDVFFVQNTGFTLAAGQIYRSTNGGTDWSVAHTSRTAGFHNLGMGSAANALFVAVNKIISTHNGGATFDSVTIADAALSDVFFVNATTAYASGTSFWKTIDAGYNWTKVSDFPAGSGSEPAYKFIHFINDQVGWANGLVGFYKTINGGVTWQPITTNPFLGSALFFTDVNTGYSSSRNGIGKTTNGGASWTQVNAQTARDQYIDLNFIDNTTGYYCSGSEIYKTTDGGTSWSRVVKVGGEEIIEIHFTDATHGWACGTGGVVLKYAP